MKIENEFIPYEQALALKKLGFDEQCFGYYGIEEELNIEISCNLDHNLIRRNFIAAPLWQQALIWFREKYKIHIVINVTIIDNWYFELYNLNDKRNAEIKTNQNEFKTYEETELACLNKLIEIVKNGKKS